MCVSLVVVCVFILIPLTPISNVNYLSDGLFLSAADNKIESALQLIVLLTNGSLLGLGWVQPRS